MDVPVRKIDVAPLRFPKKMGYHLDDVIYCTRGKSSSSVVEEARIAPPKTTLVNIPKEKLGPECTLITTADIPKRFDTLREFGIFIPALESFWVHIALGVILSNIGTITREVNPENRFIAETKIEVEMKLDIPKPPPPPPEPAPEPEPKKAAEIPKKAAPAPVKVAVKSAPPQPRAIPKTLPKVAYSAPPPPRPQAVSSAPTSKAPTGGSPANKDAPAASAAKALDFLSSGNPLKGLNTGPKGAFAPSAGRNFDAGRPVVNRASVGGVALGEGKGTAAGVGPIRTGGKFVNGDGMGVGKGLGVAGTGIQARVAVGQVHRGGGGGSISSGGALEASGPGSISQSEVTALLKRNMDKFRYCYEKALLRDASLAGVAKMAWNINTAGKASAGQVVSSDLNNNELHNCLINVIYSLRFPPAKGGSVEIRYPFVFKSTTY